jgi:hypothetical protein
VGILLQNGAKIDEKDVRNTSFGEEREKGKEREKGL